ncbi:glycosyltransferase family 4 protein [Pseudomonas synxantha]|uniref:Glycosyltransferase involved in cell wall biosynthesis n=1 Tax=Pseudomonas synxantha TaxID=47883 RepID=A0ACC6JR53_9PSED|nr:glycosyltransferase family 4 protein [Pseudomonas synxantha]MDR6608790.1 glycosyltransferase involved in cell wall biosynthesis [Pseudomonas synxantha]
MRIIHITEALGGGVLNIIQQLAALQTADGHAVTIIHSVRPDTPTSLQLADLFLAPTERFELTMATNISPLKDILALIKIFKLIRKIKPDVIHLHSSKAGVLGRIACRFAGRSNSCFYTPHGFSFLRKDISKNKRHVFSLIERLSSYFGGTTVACSQSELEHAIKGAGQKKSLLVENSIPLDLVKHATGGGGGSSCLISTSGRLCYPKNPSAFRDLALKLKNDSARFLWIGGGELENELFVDGVLPKNLNVTGWVSRDQVADFLRASDLFVMTSLWEGMPLSLMEAQASGLPAVVPNVEGCRDVVVDGVTGFVCKTADDMAKKTQLLISDMELRKKMGKAAREKALLRFAPERMHSEMLLAYTSTQNSLVRGSAA